MSNMSPTEFIAEITATPKRDSFIGRLWRGISVYADPFPSTPFQTVLAVFPHTA
jgi:hypothetical protein